MTAADAEREAARSELGRLVALARRFAPPADSPIPALRDGDRFELRWWLEALTCAVQSVLTDEHVLFNKARAVAEDDGLLLDVWRDVAKLPYEVVEQMIAFVHRSRGLWDLEAFIAGEGDDDAGKGLR